MAQGDRAKSAERYQWLQLELARLEHAYYVLDAPLLPDSEYDRLYREMLELEANNPQWIKSDSLSQRVGGVALQDFQSVQHAVPMLSLNLMVSLFLCDMKMVF